MVGVKEEIIMHTLPYDMKTMCKHHMHRYVLVQLNDGRDYDGIVEHVDDQNVYLAVPVGRVDTGNREEENSGDKGVGNNQRNNDESDQRINGWYGGYPGFGYGRPGYSYGFPGYGYYPGYGRRGRFQRLILPLAALTALSILPYY
jgi:small nuclear ribonucleoprotein (snRNP)-like protein